VFYDFPPGQISEHAMSLDRDLTLAICTIQIPSTIATNQKSPSIRSRLMTCSLSVVWNLFGFVFLQIGAGFVFSSLAEFFSLHCFCVTLTLVDC
jgi:hypothetical protein